MMRPYRPLSVSNWLSGEKPYSDRLQVGMRIGSCTAIRSLGCVDLTGSCLTDFGRSLTSLNHQHISTFSLLSNFLHCFTWSKAVLYIFSICQRGVGNMTHSYSEASRQASVSAAGLANEDDAATLGRARTLRIALSERLLILKIS